MEKTYEYRRAYLLDIRKAQANEREDLLTLPPTEAARTAYSKLRKRKQLSPASKRKGAALAPAKFSVFVETLTAAQEEVVIQKFDPIGEPKFGPALTKAISDVKPNRRPGHRHVAAEMLLLDTTLSFSVLFALFSAMGRLGHTPFAWIFTFLVPVHKKGPEANPSNNRPLGMLYAILQVYERVIFTLVRAVYLHCCSQMGFYVNLGLSWSLLE